jgi:hypothetical protein
VILEVLLGSSSTVRLQLMEQRLLNATLDASAEDEDQDKLMTPIDGEG